MRAYEVGRKGPGCWVRGGGAEEEMDEEGRGAGDADVDKVLMVHRGSV